MVSVGVADFIVLFVCLFVNIWKWQLFKRTLMYYLAIIKERDVAQR